MPKPMSLGESSSSDTCGWLRIAAISQIMLEGYEIKKEKCKILIMTRRLR
jgi:hypothetical protein